MRGVSGYAWSMEPAVALQDLAAQGVKRWGPGTSRRATDTQLAAAALDLMESFETLLELPVKALSVDFHGYADETDESIAATTEQLSQILESVRQLRATNTGFSAESFMRTLTERQPEIARKVDDLRKRAVSRIAEWERYLVFLGAGTEEDVPLGASLVPAVSEDTPPGPSVPFDL